MVSTMPLRGRREQRTAEAAAAARAELERAGIAEGLRAGDAEARQRWLDRFLAALDAASAARCEALLAAAAGLLPNDGGGLLPWCRALLENECYRQWGAAEARLVALLERDDLDEDVHSRALLALAHSRVYQGRWREAVAALEASRARYAARGDALGVAKVRTNLGATLWEGYTGGELPASVLEEAAAHHEAAVATFVACGRPDLEAIAWNNLGMVERERGRWDEALACYQRAFALLPPENAYLRGTNRNNVGEIFQRQGRLAEAEASYLDAAAAMAAAGDDYELADVLQNLGSLYEASGREEEAEAAYLRAMAAVESTRARLRQEEARAGFFATRMPLYERLIALYLRRPGAEAAVFGAVERARARALVEMLANRAVRPSRRLPAALLRRERALRAELRRLYEAEDADEATIAAREQALAEVARQIQRLDAEYLAFQVVDPLSLAEVQARLPADTALLEYYQTATELLCFLVTRDRLAMARSAGGPERWARYLDRDGYVKRVLPGPDGTLEDPWPLGEDALGAELLGGIGAALPAGGRLVVVPHGPLHAVPFAALRCDGRTLGERYRLSFAASATALLRGGPPPATEEGDRAPGLALAHGEDLRYAALEAELVAQQIGGVLLLGRAARASRLLREAPRFRVLHLACHGELNGAEPFASGLWLADGKLDLPTILRRLELRADLVALSACNSGRAQILRGDEPIGLTRAFLRAGAATVLVSLWEVDDLATALLMLAFYTHLAGGESSASGTSTATPGLPPITLARAAEALRHAQMRLRHMTAAEARAARAHLWAGRASSRRRARSEAAQHDPLANLLPDATPYAHPYYWAGFLVTGSEPPAI